MTQVAHRRYWNGGLSSMNKAYLICKWISDDQGLHCVWIRIDASAEYCLSASTPRLQPIYKKAS
jgi:hypothetical protein